MLRRLAIVLVLLVAAFWAATLYVSRPLFSERLGDLPPLPVVADRSEALTFARSAQGLLLVTGAEAGQVRAINLTARFGREATRDTLEFFRGAGYEALQILEGPEVAVAMDELGLPLALRGAHLAAGTNYAEHADEVLLDDHDFVLDERSSTCLIPRTEWTRTSSPFVQLRTERRKSFSLHSSYRTDEDKLSFHVTSYWWDIVPPP